MEPSTALETSTFDDVMDTIWRQLGRGVKDRRHGFHLGMVATNDREGGPSIRTMVLRLADRGARLVQFHCDVRSPKAGEIRRDPRAAVLFYDFKQKTQVRVSARAALETTGPDADNAWRRTTLQSRRCYLAPAPPSDDAGASPDAPPPNLPAEFVDRDPTHDESEAGRANFGIIRCTIERVDWLYLEHRGHRRAGFDWDGEAWRGRWLQP